MLVVVRSIARDGGLSGVLVCSARGSFCRRKRSDVQRQMLGAEEGRKDCPIPSAFVKDRGAFFEYAQGCIGLTIRDCKDRSVYKEDCHENSV